MTVRDEQRGLGRNVCMRNCACKYTHMHIMMMMQSRAFVIEPMMSFWLVQWAWLSSGPLSGSCGFTLHLKQTRWHQVDSSSWLLTPLVQSEHEEEPNVCPLAAELQPLEQRNVLNGRLMSGWSLFLYESVWDEVWSYPASCYCCSHYTQLSHCVHCYCTIDTDWWAVCVFFLRRLGTWGMFAGGLCTQVCAQAPLCHRK